MPRPPRHYDLPLSLPTLFASIHTVKSIMFSATMQRAILHRTLRLVAHATPSRTLNTLTRAHHHHPYRIQTRTASYAPPNLLRYLSTKSTADEKIEEITELYATAQDEFEIAMEETEKQTVYAEEDRKAAREELDKVHEAYRVAVEGPDEELAGEVRRRVGQRIRELEQGVRAMEQLAMEQD